MLNEGYFDKVYYRFSGVENSTAFANVFAIHGLGGHSMWFDNAAVLFNKNNINFFAFDLPGFGQSKYTRGTVDSYKIWIDISKEILQKFLIHFEIKAPVFILGHSMGALIAIVLAKLVKAHGWIISVPSFEGHPQSWPLTSFIVPVLSKALFNPKESITLPFGPELITKNKETQLKIKKDPLRVVNVTAQVYMHVYFLALAAKRSVKLLEESVLMLMAGNDMVCSNSAMDEYFNEIRSKDKVKKVYENSYHDLFIEDEIIQIVDDISEWIKNRAQ